MAGEYSIHIRTENIGPHNKLNNQISIGKGPSKIAIFGISGAGKSALSKQFRLLNLDPEKIPSSGKYLTIGENNGYFKFVSCRDDGTDKDEFEIKLESGQRPIIINNSKFIFHVFNSDYVKESIEPRSHGPSDEIDGYIVGKATIDLSKERKALSTAKIINSDIRDKIESTINKAKTELRLLGVRSTTNEYKEISFNRLLSGFTPKEEASFNSLKKSLQKLKNIPDDLEDVKNIRHLSDEIIIDENFYKIIQSTYSLAQIASEFKNKILLKGDFIKSGLRIIKETNNDKECPFCEQRLKEDQIELIEHYLEYFEDKESKICEELRHYKETFVSLNTKLFKKYSEFLTVQSQFNKIKEYFPSKEKINLKIPNDPNKKFEWSKLYSIIDEKIGDITQIPDKTNISLLEKFKVSLESYLINVEKQIQLNNKKIDKINLEKSDTRDELLKTRRRLCNVKFIELKTLTDSDYKKFGEIITEIQTIEIKVANAESKAITLKKELVSRTFEILLKLIFDDKYVFDKNEFCINFKNHSLKYSAGDILSDGEKSVIAFCQYLAETHTLIEKESDYDKLFFIIDDPVSSMDFHFNYTICQIIKDLPSLYKYSDNKYFKVLVFTHNLEFMSVLIRNNIVQHQYVLSPNQIKKLRRELIMPYDEHLRDIYQVSEGKSSPSHTTPNSMRHVLETINRFENPTQFLSDFIKNDIDLKSCASIHTLVQDQSHGILRLQRPILEDEVKKGCETIIKFLTKRYKGQLDHLKPSI